MKFLKFVIGRKILVSMLFLGLSLLGVISYHLLPLEIMPGIEYPNLVLQVSSSVDINPEYFEKQAIIPLEGVVGTLEGVNEIESNIRQRRGTINVYFNHNVNIDYCYIKLQEKINQVISSLPEEFTVRLSKVNTESLSNVFMRLQVRGGGGLERVRSVVENDMIAEFESIDGIAHADVTGGEQRALEIVIDSDAAKAYNITPSRIRNIISRNNQQKTFVGNAYSEDKHYFVNFISEYADIKSLENIVVDSRGPIYLRDIAEINFGSKEQTTLSRVNGKDAVIVQLVRDTNSNLIKLSHITREVIDRLNYKFKPQDIEIVIQTDTSEEMEKNINLIMKLAISGALLAVIILWLFMHSSRIVTTITLSIPLSILIAFNFFYAFNISLNSLTLIGIVLAIGMLVDDSVVVLENIYRHLSLKENPLSAVLNGTREVWRSITSSTFTTFIVFLPFVFSTNILVKLLGYNVGISITSTLFISLIVALLLIPMVTYSLLKSSSKKQFAFSRVSSNNRFIQLYRLFLKFALRYPARTILAVVALFLISITLCLSLSMDIPTEVELNQFNAYVSMPKGSTLEKTSDVVSQLENKFADIEEKEDIISTIYEEEATITIKLKDNFEKINNRTYSQVKSVIEEKLRDFRVADVSLTEAAAGSRFSGGMRRDPMTSLERMFGLGTQQEKVQIKGNDFEMLRKVADNIEYYLNQLETISNVRVQVTGSQPEIHLLFDNYIMTKNEIPISSMSTELASFESEVTSGDKFKLGSDEYDIIIKNKTIKKEKTFDDLKNLQIPNSNDAPFKLDEFSRIVYSSGLSDITRLNQRKQIEISFSFQSEINDSKSLLKSSRDEVTNLIASLNIPSDVAVEVVYDESEFSEFYFLIGAAFILIYMILASVFQSLILPVVIMFTIPLAAIGSFWALILTGNSLFNANSLTGFLILLGVVVKNGIILIDYTNILRRRGWRRARALMTAGVARVRPILITSITTIVALIPLAMGKSEYVSKVGASFAITVIGGLTFSTIFTLVFIPTVYLALETGLEWISQLNWKLKIIQITAFAGVCLLIYTSVDSPLWQLSFLFISFIVIPGFTWFITTTLKQARADFLETEKTLKINIRSMVKIYDDFSRFIKEWKKGECVQERIGIAKTFSSLKDFNQFTWQIPLLVFIIYFVYFYIKSNVWLFLLSVLLYFYALFILKTVSKFLGQLALKTGNSLYSLTIIATTKILLWGFPLFSAWKFYRSGFKSELAVFIGLCWYLTLIVYTTSNRLHRKNINIMRLTGKFAGIRRQFYRLIRVIPIIGKKKSPFKALDGVSFEIESGMFGLLGPNGAGKTTVMRIICGIYGQSRGTIRVNNINFKDKREELLGLIGYLPQEFGFYENMTAYEFLDYIAILKNIFDRNKREKLINYSLKSVHLTEHKDRKIHTYSGGMKQRLGIAMILLNLPHILVVDEPTAGLDPRERIRFRNLMVDLSKERVVIFSTHIIEDISSSCNKVAVLDKGKLYYLGEPQKMTESAEGKVWQILMDNQEFYNLREKLWIVHHIRENGKIRVRCLSNSKPYPDAEMVKPSLEDAYLWLIGRRYADSEKILAEG